MVVIEPRSDRKMSRHFPTQNTPFLGRTGELTEIAARLANPECRLLTLTGPGGSGKTRLAIEIARNMEAQFPEGAAFAALQSVGSGDLLIPTIAHAVGLSLYNEVEAKIQLFRYLGEKSLLLILDNFEHLLDVAGFISDILAHSKKIKILVTSRETLNLQEEWLYPVKGMVTPPSVYSTSIEDYEAVQLFLYHARRVHPDFDLTSERDAVIRICAIAQGLPLALELAASWLKGMSAAQTADEINNSFDFLSTSARNIEERHRSIRAVFDQSWNLLSEQERLLFAKLSAFRDGFQQQAAEQVAGASLPLLVALVEKSLLSRQPLDRWSVHELLRQYGEEKLVSQGLMETVRIAHSQYFAKFMETCEPLLKGPDQLETLKIIENDLANIYTAWNHALEYKRLEWLDQMVESIYQFGFVRGHVRESIELFQQALDRLEGQPDVQNLYGRLLVRRWGYFHWWHQTDYQDALDGLKTALQIASSAGNRFEIALCHLMYAYVLINTRNDAEALSSLEQSLEMFHELGEPFYECWVMHRIGLAYSNLGQIQQYVEWTERSLALARTTPNQVALVNCLYNIGTAYLSTINFSKGVRYCEEALEAAIALGHKGQIAHVTSLLALGAFWQNDFDTAQRLAQRGLALFDELGVVRFRAYPLSILIAVACLHEDYAEAIRLQNSNTTRDSNSIGNLLLNWASSMLACGLADEVMGHHDLQEVFKLSFRESVMIEISLLPSAAHLVATTQPALATRLLAWACAAPDRTLTWIDHWPIVARLQGGLQSRLGLAVYETEWDRGAEMAWEHIAEEMRAAFAAEPIDLMPGQLLSGPLTSRELEVLQLLGSGLTNPQIAEQLVIGAGTVKTHTLNIYRKLDVSNRTQAIVRARELGLLSA